MSFSIGDLVVHPAFGIGPLSTLYRHVLKSPPVRLATDHQQYQRDLFGHLNQGSFQGMREVLRDLVEGGRREPIGQMEMTLLRKTRESLYQE